MRHALTALAVAGLLLGGVGPAGAGIISGRVTNERGEPLAGVDLDFIVVATGQEESFNNDMTDFNGDYSVVVDSDIYDVFYDPPPASRYAGHAQKSVNLSSNQTVNVVLKDAWFASGLVTRADTNGPAAGVDLDFRDLQTDQKIYTPRDSTDANGRYSVAVPKGIYEVVFNGPAPQQVGESLLAPAHLEEVSVTGERDLVLSPVSLAAGYSVDGELLDEKGDGIVGADLDFFDQSTGTKLFTTRDNTDARARYHTILPAGTYRVEFEPPQGAPQAARARSGVTIAANTNLGTDVLNDGWALSGAARDPAGFPLRQVDLDFRLSSTGSSVPTAWDKTDGLGRYTVRIPTGTYDITFASQVNTLVDQAARPGISVASDRTLSDTILPYHDTDADAVPDVHDRCPLVADSSQEDGEGDGAGDACDNCPAAPNQRQEDNDADGAGDACDPDDDQDGLPDTSDGDMDGDGVPNAADNCPQRSNLSQWDRDADGAGDACDPDDGEVEDLRAATASAFLWAPETGAIGYQVYRLPVGWLSKINYGSCFRDDLRAPVFLDSAGPAAGEVVAYLVTALTAAGEGSLGRPGDGSERPNLRPCP